jgi:TolA-binding protein
VSKKTHIIYISIILVLSAVLSIFIITSVRTGGDYRARIEDAENRAIEYERIATESSNALSEARSANTRIEGRIIELESKLADSERENSAIREILETAISDVQSGNGRLGRITEATGKIRSIIKDMENSNTGTNSNNNN